MAGNNDEQPPTKEQRVIYPSPRRLTDLTTGENRYAWFIDNFNPPESALFSPTWRAAVEAIGVHDFNLNIEPPYQAWVLRSKDQLLKLFSNFSNESVKFILSMGDTPPRQVVVCSAGSHPFGSYLYHMSIRNVRYLALLIMLYGHRNAAPCSCCARRYARTCCPYTDSDGDKKSAHVNYPFLYCISHPGLGLGTCANCIYHVDSKCEYNKGNASFNQYDCIRERAATVRNHLLIP